MSDNLRQQSAAFRILRGIFAGYFLIQAIIWPLFGLGFLAYLSVIGAFELKDAVHIGDRGYIIGTGLLTVIPFLIGVFLIHALRGQMSRRVISKIGPLFYLTMASLLGIILSYLNPKLLLLVSAGLVPILAFTYRVRSIWRIRRILYRMLIIVVFFLAIFSKTLGAHGPTILIPESVSNF